MIAPRRRVATTCGLRETRPNLAGLITKIPDLAIQRGLRPEVGLSQAGNMKIRIARRNKRPASKNRGRALVAPLPQSPLPNMSLGVSPIMRRRRMRVERRHYGATLGEELKPHGAEGANAQHWQRSPSTQPQSRAQPNFPVTFVARLIWPGQPRREAKLRNHGDGRSGRVPQRENRMYPRP